jgi:NADH-quinone oxidoreductase subunit C
VTPDEIGAHVTASYDEVAVDVSFGQVSVEVPKEQWHDVARFVRDDPALFCGYFDWLSAYAEPDPDASGGVRVVLHVWSHSHHHQVRLRTRLAAGALRLATLTDIWPGANWHERETFEMFGVVFEGHPNLTSLLLPEGFEGHPLRKEFVLASRVAKAWPGAKEPGESDRDHDAASPGRRRMLPPGVPGPGEWGPQAAPSAEATEPKDGAE